MPRINFENYPLATVACFDATCGELPRRSLDVERNNLFLGKLAEQNVPAVLIGASTGQGHVRTPEELIDWFESTKEVDLGATTKIALLRPEDGADWHKRQVDVLVASGFEIAFVRPGNNLAPNASDQEVVENMQSAMSAIAEADLAMGVYSIPDVSGLPLRPDAVAQIQKQFGDHLVAVKVTESSFENSTRRFLEDSRLDELKIVQGWDPFLADALQADPHRCGVTSGPMSFALFQYLHILDAAANRDWQEVQRAQKAVTRLFEAMQDDPLKFADLQRTKFVMGLGQPLLGQVSKSQVERVFHALESLENESDRRRMAASLDLMADGPFSDRLAHIKEK